MVKQWMVQCFDVLVCGFWRVFSEREETRML